MKKRKEFSVWLYAFLALCLFCGSIFAQNPKIAVYVSEHNGYSDEERSVLRSATTNTLVRSGKYQVVERSTVIDKELSKQAGGSVDNDQLTAFGRQLGAQYICISDMTFLGIIDKTFTRNECNISGQCWPVTHTRISHNYQVSSRIIDVETAEIVAMSITMADIKDGAAMSNSINSTVTKMLENLSSVNNANLPKTAVYVQGMNAENKAGRALYTYVLGALFMRSRHNGDFIVVERSEAFTGQIEKELGKQRSGAVDDSQIMRMGKQYGIKQIVIAGVEVAMGNYNISARIVNVETASIERASQMFPLKDNLTALAYLSVMMVEDMIKIKPDRRQIETKVDNALLVMMNNMRNERELKRFTKQRDQLRDQSIKAEMIKTVSELP